MARKNDTPAKRKPIGQCEHKGKNRTSNENIWVVGLPDVLLRTVPTFRNDRRLKKENAGGCRSPLQYQLEAKGLDSCDIKKGRIVSSEAAQMAAWVLDTDYDGRSSPARQVLFPLPREKEGWSILAKNLKTEIDATLIGAYRGTMSLPFAPGKHGREAVKIVDDRGIESLKTLEIGA